MRSQRYLIDTNVFIGLEDDHQVSINFSSLHQVASKHGVGVYVHEVAKDDIRRDKNEARRNISLSKIAKFPLLSRVRDLTKEQLSEQFGPIKKPNDLVDATLLHALSLEVADFLVTEDRGLHERARRYAPDLARRVLFVADAVSLLTSTYESIDVPIRYVEEIEAHTISLSDPIFDTLREDYAGPAFDKWWREKCVKQLRKCWIVSDNGISGLIVRKEEKPDDTDATLHGEKILKICTFKVRPENRGIKLGELLIKQVFWFAQNNSYDLIYITTYPKQEVLIDLLEYYGFSSTAQREDGELIYEKQISRERLCADDKYDLYSLARLNYPRFCARPEVKAYGIPIKEAYHDELFPELKDRGEPDLFEFIGTGGGPRKPGNTIRKVYLCRAQANPQQAGALLLFYKGRSKKPPSQAITAIGILENVKKASSTEDLMRLAGGRSVYRKIELESWKASNNYPVKIINYLLAGYISPAISLEELISMGVMKQNPPQSIFKIDSENLEKIINKLNIGFDL